MNVSGEKAQTVGVQQGSQEKRRVTSSRVAQHDDALDSLLDGLLLDPPHYAVRAASHPRQASLVKRLFQIPHEDPLDLEFCRDLEELERRDPYASRHPAESDHQCPAVGREIRGDRGRHVLDILVELARLVQAVLLGASPRGIDVSADTSSRPRRSQRSGIAACSSASWPPTRSRRQRTESRITANVSAMCSGSGEIGASDMRAAYESS